MVYRTYYCNLVTEIPYFTQETPMRAASSQPGRDSPTHSIGPQDLRRTLKEETTQSTNTLVILERSLYELIWADKVDGLWYFPGKAIYKHKSTRKQTDVREQGTHAEQDTDGVDTASR